MVDLDNLGGKHDLSRFQFIDGTVDEEDFSEFVQEYTWQSNQPDDFDGSQNCVT